MMTTKSARRVMTLLLLGAGCGGPGYSARTDALPAPRSSDQTLAIVRVAKPWYAPDALVRSRFRDAVPEYEGYKPDVRVVGRSTKPKISIFDANVPCCLVLPSRPRPALLG